ncbi:hypothetical protein [Azospirillum sp. TSO5]|uniref:hypothetical protein n=1 Tax=Azospirillum sp. TSO5 TaxID=716760 RepID=UPI000D606D2F|nr:hypothetical protein [Azospirillum sp. TSO5]PWC98050.1 hypothetical protein TSO5_03345 [Azospirillum sp. TSO5]
MATIEALEAELRIARRDAADATERSQRAEARNVILRGKDTYDLPAVLERAKRLQDEVDELRYERDPRNWPEATRRIKRKAVAANKAREAAEDTAKRLLEALEKIAEPLDTKTCIGDPWLFYADLQAIARDAIDATRGPGAPAASPENPS